jgi:EAL domain-containing protein (putative c-di-GMP-specific phosphodiesterase class I)
MQDQTMQDRTTQAPSSFLFGARSGEELAAGLIRTYPAAKGGELWSQAGLHPRPWLSRLRRALAEDLFTLHYQPIVCLRGGGVSHHEALLRLADEPDGRLLAPGRFLPAAERYGLVRELDRMALSKAIALMGTSLADRETPVAVNLSALSVSSPGTLSHVAALLGAHGVDPGRLILELTETAAISDMARASAFCAGVRRLGCAVALDDFGTGFGSFAYLKRLPFDYLKIDGDFVRDLPRSRADQLVVQALVSVARGLGKRTIAEYVGGQETIALLRAYGVDCAQGFALGRPVAPVQAFALAA